MLSSYLDGEMVGCRPNIYDLFAFFTSLSSKVHLIGHLSMNLIPSLLPQRCCAFNEKSCSHLVLYTE